MDELSLLLGSSSSAYVFPPRASSRAQVAPESGFLVGCSLLAYQVFGVAMQGSCPCVGIPLNFAGCVFPLLRKREAEEGPIDAGSHVVPRWLSTQLLFAYWRATGCCCCCCRCCWSYWHAARCCRCCWWACLHAVRCSANDLSYKGALSIPYPIAWLYVSPAHVVLRYIITVVTGYSCTGSAYFTKMGGSSMEPP